jgi:hypothetical protein
MSEKLVKRAHEMLKDFPFKFKTLKNRTAKMYLMDICYNTEYEWAVGLDEDVYCWDPKRIIDLKEYMEKNNYDIAGPADWRMYYPPKKPFAINQYFCIVNTKNTRKVPVNLKPELPQDIIVDGKNFDLDPQFKFFYWFKKNNMKVLFLPQKHIKHFKSTIISDFKKNEFLIHSWNARSYYNNKEEKERIDEVYKYAIKRNSF